MNDIKDIRKNPEKYRESQRVRGLNPAIIDDILGVDTVVRAHRTATDAAQAKRNILTEKYGKIMKAEREGKDVALEKLIVTSELYLVTLEELIAKNEIQIEYLGKQEEKFVEEINEKLP